MTLRRALNVLFICLLVGAPASGVLAQEGGPNVGQAAAGTGFTYAGRLANGGAGVTGSCGFQFGLWNAASAGVQTGITQTVVLGVNDGYFSTILNEASQFGASSFLSATAYWLAIAVRCPDSGPYALLSPRQPLTPTPYALFSSGNWGLLGNPGGAGSFLGTTSNVPLTLKVNNTTALRLLPHVNGPNVIGGAATNAVGVAGGAAIGGGGNNTADNHFSTIAGGSTNRASGLFSTVGGGFSNTATLDGAFVGGGTENVASGSMATISGGSGGTILADFATIGGGKGNRADNYAAVVAGGQYNTASGFGAVVGGGISNTATFPSSVVSGGEGNTAYSPNATVGGGLGNASQGIAGFVGGGAANTVAFLYGSIAGGHQNTASGYAAAIGGGEANTATSNNDVVAGGHQNHASSFASTIGGGDGNTASNNYNVVAGGHQNTASGLAAVVGGGEGNTASGNYSTVPGGAGNVAQGDGSFAAGAHARALHFGSFVFADVASNDPFSSTVGNQFRVRAVGGVSFFSNLALTTGCSIAAGGGSWSCTSDRSAKANFAPVDGRAVLETLASVPIETWNFKSQDGAIRHMGPMAQDFYTAFGLGEGNTTISGVDADGVALAAIQGLYSELQEKDARIAALEAEQAATNQRLAALERGRAPGMPATSPLELALGLGVGLAGGAAIVAGVYGLGRRRGQQLLN